jgi:flavin-dependent dehydrogenase
MARSFLSNRISPGFFSWLIPHNEEYAEMGAGVLLPGNPLNALRSLSRYTGIPLPPEIRYALIPLECRKKTAIRTQGKSILLAGDAAGQVKSTTGGGVVFGTSCARLAGTYADSPEEYERRWKLLHGKDLSIHRLAHLSYGFLPDYGIRQAGKLFSFFKMHNYLEKKEQMDRPTRILSPSLVSHAFSVLLCR